MNKKQIIGVVIFIILILGITNLVTAIKVYYDGGRYVDDGTDVVWEE